MARTEIQSKKRKGAAEPAVAIAKKVKTTPEKSEKSKTLRSASKQSPSVEKTTVVAAAVVDSKNKKNTTAAKPARKRAEDFLEEKKPVKAAPKAKSAPAAKESASAKVTKAKGKKTTTTTTENKVEEEPITKKEEVALAVAAAKEAASEDEEEDDEDVDDQTAALLAGFESDEDKNDPEEDDDSGSDDEEGVSVDKLPAIPDEKNTRKQLKAAEKKGADDKPGVLYVGRIPHGFFEHQMKAYFSQFGDISHLRLARNKVTGRSKHYAFLEFSSGAVADIVAKTMDKYLLFGHILQVRRIPDDQVHPQLWKGEGRRFKVMPRNKIEGGLLNKGKTRGVWEKKIEKENKKRAKQAAKLKDIGYEFEMPGLTSVNDVPMKDAVDGEGPGLLDGGEVKAILEKQPEVAKVEVEKEDGEEKVKVTAAAKAGTKRVKAKGDGKKAKKAKVAA